MPVAPSAETIEHAATFLPAGATAFHPHLAGLGQFDQALLDVQQAVDQGLDPFPLRLNRGVILWLDKKPTAAQVDFDFVMRGAHDPQLVAAAKFYQAQVSLELDDPLTTQSLCRELLEQNSEYHPAHFLRAGARLAQQQWSDARDDLNHFLGITETETDTADAFRRRGRLLLQLVPKVPGAKRRDAWIQVRHELDAAVNRGSKSAELLYDLGWVNETLGDADKAISAYGQALEVEPNEIRIRLLDKRGWAYVNKLGDNQMAEVDFANAVQLAPANPDERFWQIDAHIGLGYVKAVRGESADALSGAGQAVAMLQLDGRSHYVMQHNLACIYGELSKHDEPRQQQYQNVALELVERALSLAEQAGARQKEVELIRRESAFPPSMRSKLEQLIQAADQ